MEWIAHLWMGEGELERDGAEGDIEAIAELGERLDLLRRPRLALIYPCQTNPIHSVEPRRGTRDGQRGGVVRA